MNFFFITSGQVESKGFPVFFPLFLGEGGQVGCKEMSRNYFSYTRAVLQLDQISSATDFYSPFGIGKMKVKSIRWDLCFWIRQFSSKIHKNIHNEWESLSSVNINLDCKCKVF